MYFFRIGNERLLGSSFNPLNPLKSFITPVPALPRCMRENLNPRLRTSRYPQCKEKYDLELAKLISEFENSSYEAKFEYPRPQLPQWLKMSLNIAIYFSQLKLSYQTVAIISGALNNTLAKKYDLEGWFPASSTYRELVSYSNCTNYQSRKLEIWFGHKGEDKVNQYVHLFNSILTAIERTTCWILENYQKEDGFEIPKVLWSYMSGKTFIPFQIGQKKDREISFFTRFYTTTEAEKMGFVNTVVPMSLSTVSTFLTIRATLKKASNVNGEQNGGSVTFTKDDLSRESLKAL
ncbi:Serine--tRNA ligase [Capsicum chinense]|nr:Serine--tRNA ligase [Capsicum chinense]